MLVQATAVLSPTYVVHYIVWVRLIVFYFFLDLYIVIYTVVFFFISIYHSLCVKPSPLSNQLAPRCERVNTHGREFPLREVLTEKLRRAMQL